MSGRRLAQMAAALKTCKILHEAGELDDRLQPVGKELIKYDDEDCEWEEHELHGQARPGTTKRKQYYNKKVRLVYLSFVRVPGSIGRHQPDAFVTMISSVNSQCQHSALLCRMHHSIPGGFDKTIANTTLDGQA